MTQNPAIEAPIGILQAACERVNQTRLEDCRGLSKMRNPFRPKSQTSLHMEEREYSAGPARTDYGVASLANRRRISWGAIIAGTVAALAVQLLLTLLGVSIGAWAIDPAAGSEGMEGIGLGAGIWALVSFIIALFCGGWIAGRMSGLGSKLDGLLEGFLVWGAVTVLTFTLLTTTIGGILGGAAGLAGNALAAGGEQVDDPQQTIQEFGAAARDALEDPQVQQEAQETTQEVGDDVATATAATSFWAFLALLLGAAAAAVAGRMGSASGLREATVPQKLPEPRR